MSTITFDTLDAARRLRDAGFDERQAETVVRVLSEAQDALATKSDLASLREHFDAKFSLVQWMLGVVLALAVANFGKQFF